MSGLVRVVSRVFFVLPFFFVTSLCTADPTPDAGPQIEPIEFLDPLPQQPANPVPPRPGMAVPTGWGSAAFSPDSKTVATVSIPEGNDSAGQICLWSLEDLSKIFHYEQPGRILMVSFSPDGNWIAIGPQNSQSGVKILDVKSGKISKVLPGPVAQTNAMAWSIDGTKLALASTSDRTIRVWDVTEGRFLKTYEPDVKSFLSVAFSKDDRLIAAGVPSMDPDGLATFDVVSGKIDKTLKGHKELIEAAVFSPDARSLTSVGWDATARVWDVASGEETATMKGHKKGIRSVSASADGKRMVTGGERELKLWDGEKHEPIADLGAENRGNRFVAMSPNGTWALSISRDGLAHLWDTEKQTERAAFDRNTSSAVTPDSPNGNPAVAAGTVNLSTNDAPEAEAIQSLAYSKDGLWIALAREDGRISVRHTDDGRVARELEAFSDVAACVAFSPDSKRLAAGSFDKSIVIWEVESGDKVAELTGHTNWVFSIAFSPDGALLASGSYDKTLKMWNIADAKEIATLTGHTAGVRSVAFSNDGRLLISGSADRTAIVWNVDNHQPVATLKGHAAAVRAVACSPDGTLVATASEDATLKLWRTSDWSEVRSIAGTEGVMFWCIAFSPAGRTLAAGAFDGTVKLYDPTDGKERRTLRGSTEAITAVAFAPGAREVIAGSIDKVVRRWKAETTAVTPKSGPAKAVELKSSEAATALNAVFLKIEQPISSLAFSKDGQKVIIGTGLYRSPGSLQLWDVTKREKIWQGDEMKFGVPTVAFSNDEQRIAYGNFADNFLRLVDANSGKQLKEIRGHRAKVTGVTYSPNGKAFATSSLDRDVKLWDSSTNKELKTFTGHADYVHSISFSPDGKRLLSGGFDKTARLWDIEKGKEVAQLKGHRGPVQQAVFSRDGSLIATAGGDGVTRVYHSTTADFLLTLRGHRNRVETVTFSPDGKLIATGSSDKTIRLWDPASGAELLKLNQEGVIRIVSFTPDGKHLASGGDDKMVTLWDLTGFRSDLPSVTDASSQ